MKKKLLYLGLDPQNYQTEDLVTHFPIITIEPFDLFSPLFDKMWQDWSLFTHLIFTSKNVVSILLEHVQKEQLQEKQLIAIGPFTLAHLKAYGLSATMPQEATAEGVVNYLKEIKSAHFLYLHSKISRNVISNFLKSEKYPYFEAALYDTRINRKLKPPSLDSFEKILFTSPSTVEAFLQIYGSFPKDKELLTIGPITQSYLQNKK